MMGLPNKSPNDRELTVRFRELNEAALIPCTDKMQKNCMPAQGIFRPSALSKQSVC